MASGVSFDSGINISASPSWTGDLGEFEVISRVNDAAQPAITEGGQLKSVKDRLWTVVYGEKPLSKSIAQFFGFKSKISSSEMELKNDTMTHLTYMTRCLALSESQEPNIYTSALQELDAALQNAICENRTIDESKLSPATQKLLEKMHFNLDKETHDNHALEVQSMFNLFKLPRTKSTNPTNTYSQRATVSRLSSSSNPSYYSAPVNYSRRREGLRSTRCYLGAGSAADGSQD